MDNTRCTKSQTHGVICLQYTQANVMSHHMCVICAYITCMYKMCTYSVYICIHIYTYIYIYVNFPACSIAVPWCEWPVAFVACPVSSSQVMGGRGRGAAGQHMARWWKPFDWLRKGTGFPGYLHWFQVGQGSIHHFWLGIRPFPLGIQFILQINRVDPTSKRGPGVKLPVCEVHDLSHW